MTYVAMSFAAGVVMWANMVNCVYKDVTSLYGSGYGFPWNSIYALKGMPYFKTRIGWPRTRLSSVEYRFEVYINLPNLIYDTLFAAFVILIVGLLVEFYMRRTRHPAEKPPT